ncbi:MAG TPA: hypothetical protein GXX72_02100 [Clostridiaceae bacterium]|nr:hypothetical protein [Clostridiaceae bacterium]
MSGAFLTSREIFENPIWQNAGDTTADGATTATCGDTGGTALQMNISSGQGR